MAIIIATRSIIVIIVIGFSAQNDTDLPPPSDEALQGGHRSRNTRLPLKDPTIIGAVRMERKTSTGG
eukprot:15474160-Alexandrium_andersonii.AAC.1